MLFRSVSQSRYEEMYQVANIYEDLEEKPAQLDPNAQLYQSISQKKKYQIYSNKFLQFLVDICAISLETTRKYISDEALIPAIGSAEFINVSEFKNSDPLFYQIRLDPSTEDMETKLGKHFMINTVLQYVGQNLDSKEIAKFVRLSPYANKEEAFSDLTIDYDNTTNMILSLDRGVYMPPNPSDDVAYLMKRIVNRMRKADFMYLPQEVHMLYQKVYQELIAIEAEQQRKIQEAALGYIPMQGAAVPCDFYVPDPSNSSKVMRARVPTDALSWLSKRLDEQGFNQKMLMQQQQGTLAEMAEKLVANQRSNSSVFAASLQRAHELVLRS